MDFSNILYVDHPLCIHFPKLPDLTQCSRLVNIAVGVIMILGGISQFFPASMSSVIVGAYVIVFGLGKSCNAPSNKGQKLMSFQWLADWNSCPTSRTTPTATDLSSSPSWAVESVSLLVASGISVGLGLTCLPSLCLCWLDHAARSRAALYCGLHRWRDRSSLPGPRVHPVHRASVEHA